MTRRAPVKGIRESNQPVVSIAAVPNEEGDPSELRVAHSQPAISNR